jgi:hypothetical protein
MYVVRLTPRHPIDGDANSDIADGESAKYFKYVVHQSVSPVWKGKGAWYFDLRRPVSK